MNIKIKKLIILADYLDRNGFLDEASIVDGLIVSAARITKKSNADAKDMHTMAWDDLVISNPTLAAKINSQTDDLFLSACGQLLPVEMITIGKGSRREPVTCQDCKDLWSTAHINEASDYELPVGIDGDDPEQRNLAIRLLKEADALVQRAHHIIRTELSLSTGNRVMEHTIPARTEIHSALRRLGHK